MGVCLIPFFQGVKLDLPYFNTDPSYGHLLRPVSSRELAGRRKVRPVSLVDDGDQNGRAFAQGIKRELESMRLLLQTLVPALMLFGSHGSHGSHDSEVRRTLSLVLG